MYALHADQSDGYGQGDAARQSALFGTVSTNSPFRTFVGGNGEVYVTGFGDNLSGVWRTPPDMTSNTQLLQGTTGPTALPAGQNHGSVMAAYVEGSAAAANLVLYTIDEDLTSAYFGGPAGDDRDSLWRYNLGGGPFPSNVTPTKVNQTNVLVPLATADVQRGADGKFYLGQNRAAGNEAGITVLDANGNKIYDTLTDSRALLANPTATDIIKNVLGMAVSEDQKWLAMVLNNSNVAVLPLVNGIPDLANRLIVNTGPVNSGRDIGFDAAGNINYVSSGQGRYRVLAPGGTTYSLYRSDSNGNAFKIGSAFIPEPTSAVLVILGALSALLVRRRSR